MKATTRIATLDFYPRANPRLRLFALWYFTVLMTVWWIGGILFLGFEQSWAQFALGAGTAIVLQFVLMWVHVKSHDLSPPYAGGFWPLVNFLIPAYLPGIAVTMLLYPNERLMPVVFAAALAICSKAIFRAPVAHGTQHFLNPSNFAISVTLLVFADVGLAPPYQFTANIVGIWDWALPAGILLSGIIVHAVSTARLPLILAWLAAFVLQAFIRSQMFDAPLLPMLVPMTSVAFILFTLYMVPDPGTTPLRFDGQIAFGIAVAAVYGVLQSNHIVYGLVLSLTIVCGVRGAWMYLSHLRSRTAELPARVPGE